MREWDVVYTYTREQAIAEGVLVDLTEWASAETGFLGGFTVPVAVTTSVWSDIRAIPEELQGLADVRGRAHDVLWMASLAARKDGEVRESLFGVILPVAGERSHDGVRTYKMVIGPGDCGEPVVTIMAPWED